MTDYFTPSHFARRPAAAPAAVRPAVRTLAEALRDSAAVARITVAWDRSDRPIWTVEAWTDHYQPVALDQAAQARLFAQWREQFPAVNWWRAHQVDLRGPVAAVGAAPAVEDDGGIPELDHTFGEHRPPILTDHTTPQFPWPLAEMRRAA